MTPYDADNQRGRILRVLRWAPQCGARFLEMHIPRYSARIWELRREGYQITRRRCDVSHHAHYSRQYLYELVS